MEKKYCGNCGVELDEGMDSCPICENNEIGNLTHPSDILRHTDQESRKFRWELFGLLSGSAILIAVFVELVTTGRLHWSLFAVTAITGIWLTGTIFTFLYKKHFLFGISLTVTLLSALVLFDIIQPPVDWFPQLGMPIGGMFAILFSLYLYIASRRKVKGFNLLAIIPGFTAVECIVIELFTDLYMNSTVNLEWSLITTVSLVPFSAVMLYIHFRLGRGKNLKSFFHV